MFGTLRTFTRSLIRPTQSFNSSPVSLSLNSSFNQSPLINQFVRHATKKAGGTVKNSPGSAGKHLGLKCGGGELVKRGRILMRQRGTKAHAGMNVRMGKDHTLTAATDGHVHFTYVLRTDRSRRRWRKFMNVIDPKQNQTKESIDEHFKQIAEDYYTVLRLRNAGIKVPTSRSIYESTKRSQEAQDKAQRFMSLAQKKDEVQQESQ